MPKKFFNSNELEERIKWDAYYILAKTAEQQKDLEKVRPSIQGTGKGSTRRTRCRSPLFRCPTKTPQQGLCRIQQSHRKHRPKLWRLSRMERQKFAVDVKKLLSARRCFSIQFYFELLVGKLYPISRTSSKKPKPI